MVPKREKINRREKNTHTHILLLTRGIMGIVADKSVRLKLAYSKLSKKKVSFLSF